MDIIVNLEAIDRGKRSLLNTAIRELGVKMKLAEPSWEYEHDFLGMTIDINAQFHRPGWLQLDLIYLTPL